MQYTVPVTVKHPNGTEITAEAVIEDVDLDWFADGAGAMRFDLDQAEDIAREMVLDELTFDFGKAAAIQSAQPAQEDAHG
jgi:hypothetical protein